MISLWVRVEGQDERERIRMGNGRRKKRNSDYKDIKKKGRRRENEAEKDNTHD